MSDLSFSAAVGKTESALLSNDDKLAHTANDQHDCNDADLAPDDVDHAADDEQSEDGATENERSDNEADAEEEDEKEADKMVDADIIHMKTLRTTTSTHDDWLHRGPYLRDIALHTYTEYSDRVRLPRGAPAAEQIFRFEHHYALSLPRGQVWILTVFFP